MKVLSIYTFFLIVFSSLFLNTIYSDNLKDLNQPNPQKVPVEFNNHGVKRIDNYHWMRDDTRSNNKVIKHLDAENLFLESWFKQERDERKKLFKEITNRIPSKDQSVPIRVKNYEYYRKYDSNSEHPKLIRRKNKNSKEQIMLNVNKLAKKHEFYQLSNWSISPQEDQIAYSEDITGRRQYKIKFKSLTSEKDFLEILNNTSGDMAWSNDGKYLFYVLRHEETLLPYKVFRHELGTPQKKDKLIYEEKDPTFYLSVGNSRSMDFIEIYTSSTTSSETLLIDSSQPDKTPKAFLRREKDHLYTIEHDPSSERFLIETNYKAKNFRLMQSEVPTNKNKRNWKELIPHREEVLLKSVLAFQKHLVVMERQEGLVRLRVIEKESSISREVSFKDPTYSAYLASNPEYEVDRFYFGYSSLSTPDSIFSVKLDSGSKRLLKQTKLKGNFSPSRYRVERHYLKVRDGIQVPVSLVYRKDLFKKSKNPIFLYGYGSYGISVDASFSSSRLSLLDRGYIFAIVHVRGGQEMGRYWYETGKEFNKLNTFYDFIDVTKGLLNKGYGDKERVFAKGGSAGGLLMGAVMNMEPSLYKGIISNVPFVDVLTTMLDPSIPLTTGEYDEWGNPEKKDEFMYMLKYSPYDNIKENNYPSILVTAGLWDSQVQYFEPAKYVAKLRDFNQSDNPILFKVNMSAGHSGVSGRYASLKEVAMEYAFLFRVDKKK
tara:strand:- start:14761 stop:16899 length:2139 start_codon:yes stop_codon:yes gene_type:complete